MYSLSLEAFIDWYYAGRDGDDSHVVPGLSCLLLRREVMQAIDIRHEMVELITSHCVNTERDTLTDLAESGKAFREVIVRLRLEEQVALESTPL